MTFVIKPTCGRGGFAPSKPLNPTARVVLPLGVRTSHVFPPIPDRQFDWCAYHDEEVENSHSYGWGATEAEALADLKRLDDERADWHEQRKDDNE